MISKQKFLDIGGADLFHQFTSSFYHKVFQDTEISIFFDNKGPHHATRLGNFLIERLIQEHDNPYSSKRGTGSKTLQVAHQRSQKRIAKREFTITDARRWQTLFFQSLREFDLIWKDKEVLFEFLNLIERMIDGYVPGTNKFTRKDAKLPF